MKYEKIRVLAYSGYQGVESPQAIFLCDKMLTIVEILDRWIEEGLSDRRRKKCFVVRTDTDQEFEIYFDVQTFQWFLQMP